ncbi:MAG: phosphoadenosine phosphosulfate reductase family protein, partial [Geobacteraceae bacterium]|nr:phosphoadenosine phosphosulfate reductase family protein [Geobacteraceae bacterium]
MRTSAELKILQGLPLQTKILWAVEKIREGYEGAQLLGRNLHLNFSGGVDSVATLRLVEMALPDVTVPVVFSDTGMEFTQLAAFAKRIATVTLKPKLFFHDVVKKCGYPAIGKTQARYLHDLQNPTDKNRATRNLRMNGVKQDGTKGDNASKLSRCYLYLVAGPKIGDGCCKHLKEDPLDDWAKLNGSSIPVIGVQAEESDRRKKDWLNHGCVGLKKGVPKISPLMIWTKSNVLEFIKLERLEYCHEIYGDIINTETGYTTTGEKRTGCVGCLFGCNH